MNKYKSLVIIGAGGHGRVVADCAESIGTYDNIIFLDDCFDERKKKSPLEHSRSNSTLA
jgi:hypothetical protein